jgi:hypothetical protein
MACALFAASPNTVTVTLPHAVTVGSTTLPSGQYTISGMEMSDGNEYFTVRGANTAAVTLQAQRIDAADGGKTQVVFSKDGESWHFGKLFLEGGGTAYEFVK